MTVRAPIECPSRATKDALHELAAHFNAAAVALDNAFTNGQAQPRPLELGREERLEELVPLPGREAGAIVAYRHTNGILPVS